MHIRVLLPRCSARRPITWPCLPMFWGPWGSKSHGDDEELAVATLSILKPEDLHFSLRVSRESTSDSIYAATVRGSSYLPSRNISILAPAYPL
ncbi:hypothetical protein PG990_004606 [Apiospora arundinis]|uniref:Uncharacterized protein n=1 Tax=Apiospora arundinis TaxID=335852 RepID=A0ABR2J6I3_9PEZI